MKTTKYASVNFRYRQITVLDGLAFYCSSGINSGYPKIWFPFMGIEETYCSYWLIKPLLQSAIKECSWRLVHPQLDLAQIAWDALKPDSPSICLIQLKNHQVLIRFMSSNQEQLPVLRSHQDLSRIGNLSDIWDNTELEILNMSHFDHQITSINAWALELFLCDPRIMSERQRIAGPKSESLVRLPNLELAQISVQLTQSDKLQQVSKKIFEDMNNLAQNFLGDQSEKFQV